MRPNPLALIGALLAAAAGSASTARADVVDTRELDEPARFERSEARGGAHHSFHTVNGNVYVRKAQP